MLIVMRRIVGWLVLLFMFGLPIWYVAHLNKDDDEADYGFLVGLHEPKQGKATFVWIINSDNEMEDYDPDDR